MTGLSALLRNSIVIIYSRGALQPSDIMSFGNGVSQLSPLRPVLGNGVPLIELIGNALTFELLSAFSNALPQVTCGQPIRGAWLLGLRAAWPAPGRIRL